MKKFKAANHIFEKLCEINEKYNILCFDLEEDDLFENEGFFYLALSINMEEADSVFVKYAYELYNLCQGVYCTEEDVKEFKEESFKLLVNMTEKMKNLL